MEYTEVAAAVASAAGLRFRHVVNGVPVVGGTGILSNLPVRPDRKRRPEEDDTRHFRKCHCLDVLTERLEITT